MKNIASGIIGLLFIFTCQAQNLYFKHLGIADGLSQIRIQTIYQDEIGAIWLGLSRGGVICIDLTTSHIAKYLAAPLSSGGVSHIFEDRYGEIYVGTTGAGMFHYQRKEDTFKQYNIQNQSLPSNFCYYIGESKAKNCLYLIHGNGISLFNTQTETIENTYRLFNQSYSLGSCLFRDKRGYLYRRN